MADLSTAISAILVLLITAVVGYVASRLDYIDEHTYAHLTKILLNIGLPCMIVASVTTLDKESGSRLLPGSFAFGFSLYFVLLILALVCNVLFRTPRNKWGEYAFMGTITNIGFIGIPVSTSLFGPAAAFVAAIFILCLNSLVYSLGVVVSTRLSGVPGKMNLRAIISGPFVAALVAIAVFLSGIKLPDAISGTLDLIGGTTAPLSMMMVGYMVCHSDLKSVVGEWRIYAFTFMRQLVVPIIIWAALKPLVPNLLILEVFVALFAMPVGVVVPLLAGSYGLDEELCAKGTILSTVLTFVTIPALAALMSIF